MRPGQSREQMKTHLSKRRNYKKCFIVYNAALYEFPVGFSHLSYICYSILQKGKVKQRKQAISQYLPDISKEYKSKSSCMFSLLQLLHQPPQASPHILCSSLAKLCGHLLWEAFPKASLPYYCSQ